MFDLNIVEKKKKKKQREYYSLFNVRYGIFMSYSFINSERDFQYTLAPLIK